MTTHCEITFDKSQPIVYVGKYTRCVNYLLKGENQNFLLSKSLWIDYRVIPLFQFYTVRKTIKTDFYFIECTSTEEINMIIESKELLNLKFFNFTSLILNYPPYLSNRNEILSMLNQLASLLTVIIITSNLNFPVEESQIIRIDE